MFYSGAPHLPADRRLRPLTTSKGLPPAIEGAVIPLEVKRSIAELGMGALRAWRTHRGQSLETLQRRSGLPWATLASLDRGEVALCEWTVDVLADSMEISPRYLLRAEQLAAIAARRTV